jgi:hypothetical protein
MMALLSYFCEKLEDVLAQSSQKVQNNESEENIDTMITGTKPTQDEGEEQWLIQNPDADG